MAAVITQLFSYMIDKGVRHGYVCTGEAYVFIYITDDPNTVHCSVNIPSRDYDEDPENRLERTAVSQVFAFIQQALQHEPPSQAWIDAARTKLNRWKVEFIDVLQKIPKTERRSRDASAYQPSEWASSTRRSPVALRSRCGPHEPAARTEEGDSDSGNDNEDMESPTRHTQTRARTRATADNARTSGARRKERGGRHSYRQSRTGQGTRTKSGSTIEHRPYCTHQCLLGLSNGLPMDPLCPNAATHGGQHISRKIFLQSVRKQLAVDQGTDADCCALYIHGSRGALLKVCLTSHGYTMVAKGVIDRDLPRLQNEERIYSRLRSLQGRHVPVCCGLTGLDVPYHYDGAELMHLLFMSWAGKSLAALSREVDSFEQISKSLPHPFAQVLRAIHQQQVLHGDAEPRNVLIDEKFRTVMLVDFEWSRICGREPLGKLSPNRKRRRSGVVKRGGAGEDGSCFRKELSEAGYNLNKALRISF